MDQEEIDKVVLAYLDKRGFKQAGLAFQQEKQQHSNTSSTAQIDPDIAKQLLSFSDVLSYFSTELCDWPSATIIALLIALLGHLRLRIGQTLEKSYPLLLLGVCLFSALAPVFVYGVILSTVLISCTLSEWTALHSTKKGMGSFGHGLIVHWINIRYNEFLGWMRRHVMFVPVVLNKRSCSEKLWLVKRGVSSHWLEIRGCDAGRAARMPPGDVGHFRSSIIDNWEDVIHLVLVVHELVRVLYPVFIHGFMDLVAKGHIQEARAFFNSFRGDHEVTHSRDLQKLEGVLSPSHLEEMEFAHSLRQSKVNIKICQYSYDLLLQYLHKSQSITMLGVINEHINFQVSPGQPTSVADDVEFVTLFGSGQDAANLINQKEIHWGLLEDSLEEKLEKTGADQEKADGELREGELEENKKRSVDGGKQGTTLKKLKKDKVVGSTAKASRSENVSVSGAPRVKPELPLPVIPVEVEQSILEDLRNRVQLSNVALPSISLLNCASISHDGSLVAGGFSDSSLKVWDMAKLGQQNGHCKLISLVPSILCKQFADTHLLFRFLIAALNQRNNYGNCLWITLRKFSIVKLQELTGANKLRDVAAFNLAFLVMSRSLGENEMTPSDHIPSSNAGGRSYTLFRGHAGPVHSATFSPFGDFLLSSSSDSTIRLWSTKLNANLVCYKGHNYPVWDVQGGLSSCLPLNANGSISVNRGTTAAGVVLRVEKGRGHSGGLDLLLLTYLKLLGDWGALPDAMARKCLQQLETRYRAGRKPIALPCASHDRTARIWSVDRVQPLRILAGHLSDVDCVQWHANCNYVATGSSDKTVRLWDVQSGECVRIFVGHRSMILCLAMSPDGRYMASGDEDGTIMMWDLATGRCVSPLVGHGSCVWSLSFSCEGSLLASGSADCTVKIWDVATSSKVSKTEENKNGNASRLRSLLTLPTKSTPVYSLQFSRRNLLFAAGALSKQA
ncbi:hypothetical protein BUALT_Bualt07G0102400 [Buddleja alternifolia]|uniref:TFIID subunit TAF5 NTD2 domain-containing protein n=1 Tax=Buddleja alternifolia TaxID=168488 RepID=A0AAV6XGL6_9LAMI|nr:hypothetical protein BUALT_Bualt07G0102400 [Buddleja alternifolia]